jgi:hypothetical protein
LEEDTGACGSCSNYRFRLNKHQCNEDHLVMGELCFPDKPEDCPDYLKSTTGPVVEPKKPGRPPKVDMRKITENLAKRTNGGVSDNEPKPEVDPGNKDFVGILAVRDAEISELKAELERLRGLVKTGDPIIDLMPKIRRAVEADAITVGKGDGEFTQNDMRKLVKAGLLTKQKHKVIRTVLWFTPEALEKAKT